MAATYLWRIVLALRDVLDASKQLHAPQGRPSEVLRLNSARISIAMVSQPLLTGFLEANPGVQVELTNDEGYVHSVEREFDAGVRLGQGVQRDMVALPLGGPISVAGVGSPAYLKRHPALNDLSKLVDQDCVRFRFSGSGAIYKWKLEVEGGLVEYKVAGNLTISGPLFSNEAALEGLGLAYTFEQLALLCIRTKRL